MHHVSCKLPIKSKEEAVDGEEEDLTSVTFRQANIMFSAVVRVSAAGIRSLARTGPQCTGKRLILKSIHLIQ